MGASGLASARRQSLNKTRKGRPSRTRRPPIYPAPAGRWLKHQPSLDPFGVVRDLDAATMPLRARAEARRSRLLSNTETLGIPELAALLHLAPSTVRSDVSRRPWMLPPFIKLGIKTIWLRATVLEWLKAREQAATPPVQPVPSQTPKRRGRPSKLDQLRRQRERTAEASA